MLPTYERSIRHDGDPPAVLDAARDVFVHAGFQLTANAPDYFEVAGPGMHSTKQDPLLGVSWARVMVGGADIQLRAELGNLRKIQYFAIIFPIALVVVLCVALGLTVPNGEMFVRYAAPAMLLQFFVIGLFMAWWMRRRTERAIDVALNNAVMLGR